MSLNDRPNSHLGVSERKRIETPVVRDRPVATARLGDAVTEHAAGERGAGSSAALRAAIRAPRFWLLALALASVNIPGAGVVAQLAPMLGDKGLTEERAALLMSVDAGGMLLGRLLTGFSLDRLPTAVVAAPMTLVPAIGIALLRAPTLPLPIAAVAVLMLGLQQGSEVDLIAYIVSRSFGVEHYGAIYGALGVAGAVSKAASFVFFGKVHDLTGSYDIALTTGALAFCIGAVAFTAVGRAESTR